MISYKLEYIAGSKSIYNLWETIDDENGVDRNIVAIIYDPGIAVEITEFLNEQENERLNKN